MINIERREPKIETESDKKAEEIFDWFREGKLREKDLKDWGLEAENLEKEIKELIIAKIREELKEKNLKLIAESKDFTGRTKTSVYSRPELNYVVKKVDDIGQYILAERKRTNGIVTGFVRVKDLECKIDDEKSVIPEAVIPIKATPLKEEFEKLLKEGKKEGKKDNLSTAEDLMGKFVDTVIEGWRRGFHLGLDHFTEDFGEEASGKVTCFDPAIEPEKPRISSETQNILSSLSEFKKLNPEFAKFGKELIWKKLTQETLNNTWEPKSERGGMNVFIPDEETVKNIRSFLERKLEKKPEPKNGKEAL